MALFGKIFEKKNCDICGNEIKFMGNRKLEDGNLCKECASKLSPFFSERRRSTVEDIRGQLEYREANQTEVAAFNVTRTLGNNTKVLLDEDAQKFIVTSATNWQSANPDVIPFSQMTGCESEIKETKTEIMRTLPDGKKESYNPKRYDTDYDFYIKINVNNPYFDEISFKVNPTRIDKAMSIEYKEAERVTEEIKRALTQVRTSARRAAVQMNQPKKAVICQCCGATTIPDASGCCEYCGGLAQ
ncbi:MAG: DUF4428 domain-containing protein [Clostridia bacterium]|nr:DUF4428 domain-containing protein [Clostridia bacterium]MBR3195804.1 DUF4428 domain-containing protein [Clostridia bacterium]